MQNIEELRKLEAAKLESELKNAKEELFKVKFEVRNGQSKSNHLIDDYKDLIARIETVKSEHRHGESLTNTLTSKK